jgi:hypothetical protein
MQKQIEFLKLQRSGEDVALKSAGCKSVLMHVASVLCGCYKSRSGCCICCNGYTHILQASVPNVSIISYIRCTCFMWVLHMFHTYIASVSSGCCICFTYNMQGFHLDVAYVLQWLHMCFSRVSDVCCTCFL